MWLLLWMRLGWGWRVCQWVRAVVVVAVVVLDSEAEAEGGLRLVRGVEGSEKEEGDGV
jgi:hypothetical protein